MKQIQLEIDRMNKLTILSHEYICRIFSKVFLKLSNNQALVKLNPEYKQWSKMTINFFEFSYHVVINEIRNIKEYTCNFTIQRRT